jgi:hypothetical protein
MYRLALGTASALTACGAEVDDRPANLDYITEAILAPSCGGATCHSSFRREQGLTFDNVDDARATFQGDEILIRPSDPEDPNSPSGLFLNLTTEQPGAPRMPFYEPMPDHDIALIDRWLRGGAAGVCVGGATACLGENVVPCNDKGAYDLATLDTPDAPNCLDVGSQAGIEMSCVKGACVAVTP